MESPTTNSHFYQRLIQCLSPGLLQGACRAHAVGCAPSASHLKAEQWGQDAVSNHRLHSPHLSPHQEAGDRTNNTKPPEKAFSLPELRRRRVHSARENTLSEGHMSTHRGPVGSSAKTEHVARCTTAQLYNTMSVVCTSKLSLRQS